MSDEQYMNKAIELALRGSGNVSPNPLVGAVIVKDDNIISEGWHSYFGGNHAEVEAINNAKGTDLSDSTLYINLEPCAHKGKTPPCVDLIIEKKIKRVVVGMIDPNPITSGMGIQMLEEAGVEVEIGVLENDCLWVNRFFAKHITTGLPYIVVKVAQSFDGSISTISGQSKWISCEESRKRTHALRAEIDAVLIGRRTASADNPELTVRSVDGRNPMRIILDTNLSLPLGITNFVDAEREKTIVCCKHDTLSTRKAEILKVAGIKLVACDVDESGKINLNSALYSLYEKYNIGSILVEGGAVVFSSFAKQNLIDELHIFIAPMILGNGIHAFSDFAVQRLDTAQLYTMRAASKSGTDIHIIATKN